SVLPKTGDIKNAEGVHPFVMTYASRAIDYLGGDTGLGSRDLNPARSLVTSHIFENLEGSNPHERANGIRWILLFVGFIVCYYLVSEKRRKLLDQGSIYYFIFFLAFAAFGFWLSLSPLLFG